MQPAAPVTQAEFTETDGGRNDEQVLLQGPPQNQAGQCGSPPPLAQSTTPAPLVRLTDILAQVEETIRNTFGTKARQAIRPVFRSPYPVHIDTDHLYPVYWNMPKFDKFSGEENENTIEHVTRFTTQCREVTASPFLKMRLFSTSLTKTAFLSRPGGKPEPGHVYRSAVHTVFSVFTKRQKPAQIR